MIKKILGQLTRNTARSTRKAGIRVAIFSLLAIGLPCNSPDASAQTLAGAQNHAATEGGVSRAHWQPALFQDKEQQG